MTDDRGPDSPRKRKPLEQATEQGRKKLGEQLAIRRGELGFGPLTDFHRANPGLSWRTYTDIENGYRENVTAATLGQIARVYQVSYDSMLAVAYGSADKLEPAPGSGPRREEVPRAVPDIADVASGLMSPDEMTAAAPHWMAIMTLVLDAASRTGQADPPGEAVFGPGEEADDWDRPRHKVWPPARRALFMADIRAKLAARETRNRGTAAGLGRSEGTGGAA